jgi:carbon storage regulator CsrA
VLVLKRKLNEGLVIGNDIFITVTAVDSIEERVELVIDLPDGLVISLPESTSNDNNQHKT